MAKQPIKLDGVLVFISALCGFGGFGAMAVILLSLVNRIAPVASTLAWVVLIVVSAMFGAIVGLVSAAATTAQAERERQRFEAEWRHKQFGGTETKHTEVKA